MAKENNLQEFRSQQLRILKNKQFHYPSAKKFVQPLSYTCLHCGVNRKVERAELFLWSDREPFSAGWVAVCPVCGSRQVLDKELLEKKKTVIPTVFRKTALFVAAAFLLVLALWTGATKLLEGLSGDEPAPAPNGGASVSQEVQESELEQESGIEADIVEDVEKVSYYEVFWEDVNWDEAEMICESMEYNGVTGHLATVTSEEEFELITDLLDKFITEQNDKTAEKINYVWLGGWISDSDALMGKNRYQWITGEDWVWDRWCRTDFVTEDAGGKKVVAQIHEPSFIDENTRVIENRLSLWQLKKDELGWTFSDQDGSILDSYPTSSGKIAFVCEYDESVEQ